MVVCRQPPFTAPGSRCRVFNDSAVVFVTGGHALIVGGHAFTVGRRVVGVARRLYLVRFRVNHDDRGLVECRTNQQVVDGIVVVYVQVQDLALTVDPDDRQVTTKDEVDIADSQVDRLVS